MDYSFILDALKIIILLPMIIFLIYGVFRLGGKYIKNVNSGRIIKVYERINLSQNVFISVVSILDKVYVISNTNNEVKILLELDKDAVSNYKDNPIESDLIKLNFLKRKSNNEWKTK